MREARVQAYLADVERGLASVRPADRDEALRELTSLLDELASAVALDEVWPGGGGGAGPTPRRPGVPGTSGLPPIGGGPLRRIGRTAPGLRPED